MRLDNTILIFAACTPLLLAGCSNDSPTNGAGNNSGNKNDNQAAYVALTDAGACDYSRYGKEIYVATEGKYYVCVNGSWTLADAISPSGFNGASKDNSSAESLSSASGEVNPDNGIGVCAMGNDGEVKRIGDSTYYCTAGIWRNITWWDWDIPKEARQNPNIEYGTVRYSIGEMEYGDPIKTVTIGGKTWMAENLNLSVPSQIYNGNYESWCYDDIEGNCAVGGRLYPWGTAMDSARTGCGNYVVCNRQMKRTDQGICPNGWHVPTVAEWEALFDLVQTSGKVKSTNGWNPYDYCDGGNGEDAYGFSILPTGLRTKQGRFSGAGEYAVFWTSSQVIAKPSQYNPENSTMAYYVQIRCNSNRPSLISSWTSKEHAYSVRCVKNE